MSKKCVNSRCSSDEGSSSPDQYCRVVSRRRMTRFPRTCSRGNSIVCALKPPQFTSIMEPLRANTHLFIVAFSSSEPGDIVLPVQVIIGSLSDEKADKVTPRNIDLGSSVAVARKFPSCVGQHRSECCKFTSLCVLFLEQQDACENIRRDNVHIR